MFGSGLYARACGSFFLALVFAVSSFVLGAPFLIRAPHVSDHAEVARSDVKVDITTTMIKLSLRGQVVIAVSERQAHEAKALKYANSVCGVSVLRCFNLLVSHPAFVWSVAEMAKFSLRGGPMLLLRVFVHTTLFGGAPFSARGMLLCRDFVSVLGLRPRTVNYWLNFCRLYTWMTVNGPCCKEL